MTKKKIIVLMHYLELGGAEMALIGLLHALDKDRVDVNLFLYEHRGYLMQYIPKWVNLMSRIDAYASIEQPLVEAVKHCQFGVVCGRLQAKFKHRKFIRKHKIREPYSSQIQYVGDCVTPWLPKINPSEEYDLCISFLAPHNIGRDKVRAKKRIAWIHTDYSTIDIDIESELCVWSAYDRIVSISPDVTSAFIKTFPSLYSRIIEIENIIPSDYVKYQAEAFEPADMALVGG